MEMVQTREQKVSKADLGLTMEEHTYRGFELA